MELDYILIIMLLCGNHITRELSPVLQTHPSLIQITCVIFADDL